MSRTVSYPKGDSFVQTLHPTGRELALLQVSNPYQPQYKPGDTKMAASLIVVRIYEQPSGHLSGCLMTFYT
jgi:hypothetical protein